MFMRLINWHKREVHRAFSKFCLEYKCTHIVFILHKNHINPSRWWFMMLNATFINISDISWWSVLLVEGAGVPSETTTYLRKSLTNNYHIMLYRVHLVWVGFELTTLVVIGTDCMGSYKSNYHTITSRPRRPHQQYVLLIYVSITSILPTNSMWLFCYSKWVPYNINLYITYQQYVTVLLF